MENQMKLKHDVANIFAQAYLTAPNQETITHLKILWVKVRHRLEKDEPAFMRVPDALDLLGGTGD